MGNKNLEWALKYHRAGWIVFPCSDKKPIAAALKAWNGSWACLRDEGVSEDTIKEWWERFPDAQIAVACGKKSGITVVDIDWLKILGTNQPDLQNSLDPAQIASTLPTSLMSITGGRGRHVFYRYTDVPNSVKMHHPQIDVRSEGGYVIVPPSTHENGHSYMWDEEAAWSEASVKQLSEFPFEKHIASHHENKKGHDWQKLMRGVIQGSRNQTATVLAGKLIRSLEPHLSWELLELWNAHRNQPPLSFEELSNTFISILEREYAKRSNHRK
jgi:hypothetical protein